MDKDAAPEQLGRYEIIRELGKGAMGVVYEGRDPSLGRTVAIKTARQDVIEKSGLAKEMMERFLREARAAGMLSHPNIITIYDVGEQEGMAYIAMEYLVGKDMDEVLDEKTHFEPEETVNYGVQICEALACAHDQGVCHRDVKPANIFIPDKGGLKVVDFGIARTHDSTLTQDGALIGTPTYMSPEQFMGRKVDGRSDLFSAGIILYEMLTGEKPFTGEALTTIMHHILKSDPAPPSELNYTVPDALSAVVMRALSKKPQDRYPDGRVMAAALRESLKDNPDMSIIKGKSNAAAETIVSSAPVQQMQAASDGTVMDATVAGDVPSSVHDATVAGGAPPPLASESPRQVTSPPASTQPEAPQPTSAAAPPKQSFVQIAMKHSRLVFGGIAVFCLVLGFSMYMIGTAQVPMEEVPIYVYTTDNPGAAMQYENLPVQKREAWIAEQEKEVLGVPARKMTVRVSDLSQSKVIAEEKIDDIMTFISLPQKIEGVYFDFLQEDGKSFHGTEIRFADNAPSPQYFVFYDKK